MQSGAEVSTSFHLWNENRRAMDRADCQLVSLSFENHFVVELLWPLSREESAVDDYGQVLKSTTIFNEFFYWNQVQRSLPRFTLWNKSRRAMDARILEI